MSERFVYDRIGAGYAQRRRPDPRISRQVEAALGSARSVVNVGAGTGSYEPSGRRVVALEPSLEMIEQRQPRGEVVRGVAEALPFQADSFDAALAVLTVHHWTDWRRGVAELRRVARSRVVLLTWDPVSGSDFWLFKYFPGILERDEERMPALDALCVALGGIAEAVPIPRDCEDGFLATRWGDPAHYLDGASRAAMSGFRLLEPTEVATGLQRLQADLADGAWHRRWGDLQARDELDCGYRLVISGRG